MFKKLILLGLILSTNFCANGNSTRREVYQDPNPDSSTPVSGSEAPTIEAQLSLPWSNPETWGGTLPASGEQVSIPEGVSILLDVTPPPLAGLTIHGELIFADQDLFLTSDFIMVQGSLQIGSEIAPYAHHAVITLTGTPVQDVMGMGSRGLMVMNGELILQGSPPVTPWTQINGHIDAGDTSFEVLDNTGWRRNDRLVIAPTDFYGATDTQQLQISSLSGSQLDVIPPVTDFRWGLLQYATNSGMSLTPGDAILPPAPPSEGSTPLILDERAEVGNLTRNIIIQGNDDVFWQEQGFGAHIMIMGLNSVVQVNGIEVRRAGQSGILARYPFHWHGLSYNEAGDFLGDATGHYVRNSTFHDSTNRCVTIHGTNGVTVENNICFDILGHAIFLEDAVERRNVIQNNLVLHVRNPTNENALKLHDTSQQLGFRASSSGIWASNPDNTIRGNVLADCEGFGLWMAFPENPVGLFSNVNIRPDRTLFGNFDHNVAHSNHLGGVMIDNAEVDNLGNVAGIQYASTIDGQEIHYPYENLRRFTIVGLHLWKNGANNLWDRAVWQTFEEIVSADSVGKLFAGVGPGRVDRSLAIGTSLNNFSTPPEGFGPPVAFASYHGAFDVRYNIVINFPHVEGLTSGFMGSDDYYLRPVEKSHIRNFNNLLINTHPGHRSRADVDEDLINNFAQGVDYYVFSGALWDPFGYWGLANQWNVYDEPFFTHGAHCTPIEPLSQQVTSCDGDYYGVNSFVLDLDENGPNADRMALSVTRFDDANPDLAVGLWEVAAAAPGVALGHMRHFVAHENGTYLLDFPGVAIPSDVAMEITNMLDISDQFVLAVRFSGAEDAQVYSSTYTSNYLNEDHATAPSPEIGGIKQNYREITDADGGRATLLTESSETYWQDHANDLVWIKLSPGDLEQFSQPLGLNEEAVDDLSLYNPFYLRIW